MIRPHGHSATIRKSGERIPHNVALDVAAGGSVLSPNMDGPSCAIRKRRRGDYDGTVAVQAVSFATFEEFLDWSGTKI